VAARLFEHVAERCALDQPVRGQVHRRVPGVSDIAVLQRAGQRRAKLHDAVFQRALPRRRERGKCELAHRLEGLRAEPAHQIHAELAEPVRRLVLLHHP
jgi:hypothetical protein